MEATPHRPVLVAEVLAAFPPQAAAVYLDATVGLGGHANALLERAPDSRVIGLDLDPDALRHAASRLAVHGSRVRLVAAPYRDLTSVLDALDVPFLHGVLFDLGVSSLQLDTPERGFSFRHDGPLDMRFSRSGETAAEWLATVEDEELMRALREFGEEPRARRVARAIVRARDRAPITTTSELRRIVHAALGGARGRIDPATRTFQAVRIATNRELEGVPGALELAARRLVAGGRLAVISFHSLEDRLVKRTLRRLSGRCVCPPGTGECACRPEALLEVLTRRPIGPGEDECRENPRARSAKLRVAARRST